jgi:DNA-binding NarL/FixJ family response regulator
MEMPEMDGIETTQKVTELYPSIKILAFSANKVAYKMCDMIGAGACAWLYKGMSSADAKEIIHEVHRKNKYQADLYHIYEGKFRSTDNYVTDITFTEDEKLYLQLFCKGLDYAEIVKGMPTVDGIVHHCFKSISKKLETKNHALIAMEVRRMGVLTKKKSILIAIMPFPQSYRIPNTSQDLRHL